MDIVSLLRTVLKHTMDGEMPPGEVSSLLISKVHPSTYCRSFVTE